MCGMLRNAEISASQWKQCKIDIGCFGLQVKVSSGNSKIMLEKITWHKFIPLNLAILYQNFKLNNTYLTFTSLSCSTKSAMSRRPKYVGKCGKPRLWPHIPTAAFYLNASKAHVTISLANLSFIFTITYSYGHLHQSWIKHELETQALI